MSYFKIQKESFCLLPWQSQKLIVKVSTEDISTYVDEISKYGNTRRYIYKQDIIK